MIAYVDGKWTPAEEARISVLDHGLLYGDGVFEGIRVYGGRPFLLDEHLDRLAASARAIVLELPAERAEIAALCREAARARRARRRLPAPRRHARRGRARRLAPHLRAREPDRDRGAAHALPAGALPRRRAARHLQPAPQRERRAAAADQEPQLPDERAGVDRGPPPGRRRGRAAERAGPDRRVHRRQPLPRQPRARAHAGGGERRARGHHARARLALLGEQGIECVEARAHAGRRVDGRRAVPDRAPAPRSCPSARSTAGRCRSRGP